MIGIIPAKGVSVRVPDKNIQLIRYTVDVALASELTAVVVATDCPHIAQLCPDCVIFERRDVDGDLPSTSVAELIDVWPCMVLQPTSPLRTVDDINNCIDLCPCVSVNPSGQLNGAVYCMDRYGVAPWDGYHRYVMPLSRSLDIDTPGDMFQFLMM